MNNEKMIKNEQLVRNKNRSVGTALKRYFGGNKEIINTPLEFVCECSDINCKQIIKISIAEYEKLHRRNDRFLIVKGHKTHQIEKTVSSKGRLELIEKPGVAQ